MKYIIIVPDGMADHPIKEFNGKTPLEAANTTNMDYMAKNGLTGMVKTIPDDMPPGSDVGNISILGYDPSKSLTGRAPLEAANQGITLADNEVAIRCNLVTIENGTMADYSAGHIRSDEAEILIKTLNEKVDDPNVRFYAGKSYRNLLVIKTHDPKKYMQIKTFPPHDILDKKIKDYLPKGPESQMLLKLIEKSKEVFENHDVNRVRIDLKENPATQIWLWGQGTRPKLTSFKEKFNLNGGIISAVDVVAGIGKLAGLEIIDVPGITGYYDTNYLGKAEYALESLKRNDFVYIHIEAPDEAGHNGDAQAKRDVIERIDKEVVGTILNKIDQYSDVRVMILPDHPTPVDLRTHTREPVAFLMYGKGIPQDGSDSFSEKVVSKKGLKFKSAEELTNTFIKKYL